MKCSNDENEQMLKFRPSHSPSLNKTSLKSHFFSGCNQNCSFRKTNLFFTFLIVYWVFVRLLISSSSIVKAGQNFLVQDGDLSTCICLRSLPSPY